MYLKDDNYQKILEKRSLKQIQQAKEVSERVLRTKIQEQRFINHIGLIKKDIEWRDFAKQVSQ